MNQRQIKFAKLLIARVGWKWPTARIPVVSADGKARGLSGPNVVGMLPDLTDHTVGGYLLHMLWEIDTDVWVDRDVEVCVWRPALGLMPAGTGDTLGEACAQAIVESTDD